MTTPKLTADRITTLQASLDELAARAQASLERVEAAAEETIKRLARGTMDGWENPAYLPQLAALASTPAPEVAAKRRGRARRDAGITVRPNEPALGDKVSPQELKAAIIGMISLRPHTFREIHARTAARPARIYGVFNTLKLEGAPLVHLGKPRRGSWYLVPQGKTSE